MKKIVSLMALCAVLFGVVLMATGCGSKPEKGTVWQMTKYSSTTEGEDAKDNMPGEGQIMYVCFHSDGNFYIGSKAKDKELTAEKVGEYAIDSKSKKVACMGMVATYTEKSNKMILTSKYEDDDKKTVTTVVELQKSKDYTEAQIKAAVGK